MDDVFSPKYLLLVGLFGVLVLCSSLAGYTFRRNAQVVICDVGNGDSIYIRTSMGTDVLVDAGKSKDVLACLGTHMPITDSTIEYAIITHPHIDHYGGFIYVLEKYTVETMVVSEGSSEAKTYDRLMSMIEDLDVNVVRPYEYRYIYLDENATMKLLWPTVRMVSVKDPNDVSVVSTYTEFGVDVMLTGDATPNVLEKLVKSNNDLKADILKVPHHGSSNGLTRDFLAEVSPKYAVISAGKDNSYGHPSESILDMLEEHHISYAGTYDQGHIKINLHPDGTFSL